LGSLLGSGFKYDFMDYRPPHREPAGYWFLLTGWPPIDTAKFAVCSLYDDGI
jgi:hypothetical protein